MSSLELTTADNRKKKMVRVFLPFLPSPFLSQTLFKITDSSLFFGSYTNMAVLSIRKTIQCAFSFLIGIMLIIMFLGLGCIKSAPVSVPIPASAFIYVHAMPHNLNDLKPHNADLGDNGPCRCQIAESVSESPDPHDFRPENITVDGKGPI